MKKTLLATALSVGFAGATQAQTSVTLYGVLDAGVGYLQYKTQGDSTSRSLLRDGGASTYSAFPGSRKFQKTGLVDGIEAGGRWGLRGSENLGNGLKAIFQLESGFSPMTGRSAQGGRLFGRQAWLGLESDDLGTIAFGRQVNYGSRWAGIAVPWGDSFAGSNGGRTFTAIGTVRLDNMLSYTSPVFSGFQFGAGYSFNAQAPQNFDVPGSSPNPKDSNQEVFTAGVRYNDGPLAAAAVYDHELIHGSGTQDIQSFVLAASYDFDVVKLHLGFGHECNGVFTDRADGIAGITPSQVFGQTPFLYLPGYRAVNYSAGLSMPINANSRIAVAWQSSKLRDSKFKDTYLDPANRGKATQNLYSVVYQHTISKRTSFYANVAYGNGIAFNEVKMTRAVMGVRHNF